MGTITPINPQVVYTQATTPDDLTEGKIWYNTTNNSIYSSDGINYVLLESDLSPIVKHMGNTNLNILELEASASLDFLNLASYSDIFSTNNGLKDTINTTGTNAYYSDETYKALLEATQTTGSASYNYKTFTINGFLNFINFDIYFQSSDPTERIPLIQIIYSDDTTEDINFPTQVKGSYISLSYIPTTQKEIKTITVTMENYISSNMLTQNILVNYETEILNPIIDLNNITTNKQYDKLFIYVDAGTSDESNISVLVNSIEYGINSFIDLTTKELDINFKLNSGVAELKGYSLQYF